jgi:acyl-CoA thioester hydrolase
MVRTQIRVIYGDTDQMGVVYYANYLRYFEAGRNELIRARGLRYRDFEARFGLLLPVVEAGVKYVEAARYDDLISVETTLAEVRRASARFTYRLLRDQDLLATGFTVHACIDPQGRVRRLPTELVQCLQGGGEGAAGAQRGGTAATLGEGAPLGHGRPRRPRGFAGRAGRHAPGDRS